MGFRIMGLNKAINGLTQLPCPLLSRSKVPLEWNRLQKNMTRFHSVRTVRRKQSVALKL
jgi:hypothetical protein